MPNRIQRAVNLKDGTTAYDPRLGRLVEFDERSRGYPLTDLLSPKQTEQVKGRKWYMPRNYVLDQGDSSACTGFSRTYDLAASPTPIKVPKDYGYGPPSEVFAKTLYDLARKFDEWPGEDYEGSSVLGAFKAAINLGFIGEYRWAFGIDDFVAGLSHLGPLVVGTNWLNSMFDPQPNGLVIVYKDSGVAGGHAYMFDHLISSRASMRRYLGRGEPIREADMLVGGPQSWGKDWGHNGRYLFWASDLEQLLEDDGEAAVTTVALHK